MGGVWFSLRHDFNICTETVILLLLFVPSIMTHLGCDSSCETCAGNATICTSCMDGYGLLDGTCRSKINCYINTSSLMGKERYLPSNVTIVP